MSQKINPTSFKLGILQLWNFNLPKYGKQFQSYKRRIQIYKYICYYVKHVLRNHQLLLNKISIRCINQQVLITVSLFCLQPNFILLNKNSVLNTIFNWLKSPLILHFYQTLSFNSSSFLLSNYIAYLIKEKNISAKKLLQQVHSLLKTQAKIPKLIYTVSGVRIVSLKGFKIQFSGCFEASRSQMAKTIKCNFGLVPLTKLNGFIDYSNNTIFTKFGTCGLKIWLFYEFKSF
uniref:Ribosomal protein S3 n=1 Tax=Corallina ferreyrae TaxID=2547422 RepID=A0A482CG21_9FLOR|nr:ribosomal protein S3 [Corallina ferreyrae]QBL75542.1 ribosomal protein S3 [Corallina ferreyrae]